MKKILSFVILIMALQSYSQKKDQNPLCATDEIINTLIRENPEFKEQLDRIDFEMTDKNLKKLKQSNSTETVTIPIIVYVVHGGVTSPENISDSQVMSQIDALNTYFSPYNINFCLATSVNGVTIPLKNLTTDTSTTPGIIHVNNNVATNHTVDMTGMVNLVNVTHNSITKDRYLRIWVVKNINGTNSNIGGYGTFANSIPYIDGIVMKYNYFGNASSCQGCSLQPNYNQGKILVHEIGHYLGLYHTFYEGCSGMDASRCSYEGDRVCDTPPVAGPSNCILGANTCSESPNLPDNIHNFMDYGVSACLYEFTQGQKERMLHYLETRRKDLSTNENIIYTRSCGYENLITAEFQADKYAICSSTSISFTSITQENTDYLWDFGDGNTSTDPNPIHTYLSGINSPYSAKLTVTSGDKTATYNELVFVTDCLPIQNSSTYWYVGRSKGLDFSSGVPIFDNSFPTNHDMNLRSATFQNDQNGNLLYYNSNKNVWDGNHNQINTIPLNANNGDNPHKNQILSLPKPGNPSKSYIFSINQTDGFNYSIVNINGSNLSMGLMNQPIDFPANNYLTAQNGAILGISISAVENCNGYWIIVALCKDSSTYLAVYSLNSAISADLSFVSEIKVPTVYASSTNIEISPNGNKIFAYDHRATTDNYKTFMFDFDKLSGIISSPMEIVVKRPSTGTGLFSASFSPDSQLLYVVNNGNYSIDQYNINTGSISNTQTTVGEFPESRTHNMQLGPDKKIYIANIFGSSISTIHAPNNKVSSTTPNACYYSEYGPVSLLLEVSPYRQLPHIIDAKYATAYDPNNKISVYVAGTSCNSYKFFPNVCGTSFKWEFQNLTTGGNIVATSIENNPVYNFTISGNYLITLKDAANQFIASKNLMINGMTAPVIQGNSTTCITGGYGTSSNSVILEEGSFATWSILSGPGTISGVNNQADFTVNWTSLPGTISVTVTNANNCSTTVQKTITSSCIVYGANHTVYTSSLQSDGKIIFGGDFTAYSGVARNRIARLNGDMTLDTSFSIGTGTDNSVKATAIQSDGRVIIGGTFTNFNGFAKKGIARLNSNGSNDTGFTTILNTGGYINAIAIQSDGKIIIAGKFNECNGIPRTNLARLNSDGSVDSQFFPNQPLTGEIHCVAIENDGKILAGGALTGLGSNIKIVRLNNTDGAYLGSFNSSSLFDMGLNPNPIVYAIKIQPNGKILVGGTFTTPNAKNNILRLNTNGTTDTTFLPDDTFSSSYGTGVRAIGLQNDKIIIGGGFHSIGGSAQTHTSRRIARLSTNGTVDLTFNSGIGFGPENETSASRIHTLNIQSDNKIITGGSFNSYNSINVNNITRIDFNNPGSVNRPAIGDGKRDDNNVSFTENNKESSMIYGFNDNPIYYYPNPVKDVLNLSYDQAMTNVAVFNLLGQKVIEKSINANSTQVDMSNLATGSYLVKVTSDNQTKTIKVIKQ